MSFQKNIPSPTVIIVGCGFLGKATAQLFSSQGYQVLGIVRTAASQEAITTDLKNHSSSFHAVEGDVTSDDSVTALSHQIHSPKLLIYAVSSGKGNSETYAAVYRDGLARVLSSWKPQKTIFVSSTSVYAQQAGEMVTETSPAHPERLTSQLLLEAEAIALAAHGSVARLSGIYGPGRSVLLKKFLSGEAILEEGGSRWINQIHRDDAALALFQLGTKLISPGIYNVTDDTPVTQRDVYQWMADELKKPLPPEGPANRNRKRAWTSKRISNQKLRNSGWIPQFPSYREALPSLLSSLR